MEHTNPSFIAPRTSLDLTRFRNLPQERHRRSPKMLLICRDLVQHPGSTRREVMGRVNPERDSDSNRCYFRRMHTDQTRDALGRKYHDEATYSVLLNGLVRVSGKTKTGHLTYEVTDAGREFAAAA